MAKKPVKAAVAATPSAPAGGIDYSRLNEICAATAQGGMVYSGNDDQLRYLVSIGYAEINQAMVQRDVAGQIASFATRATAAGMQAWEAWKASQPVAGFVANPVMQTEVDDEDEGEEADFIIEDYSTIPTVERGQFLRPRTERYPFTRLMPGQRFFIPRQISAKSGKVVRHYAACNSAGHRLRDMYGELVARNEAIPATLVPKHFDCVTVRKGQVLDQGLHTQVVCQEDGEYVFCIAGWLPPSTPRTAADAA